MLTALPATGAAGAVTEGVLPAGMFGMFGMALMPGIPGVVAPDPKVTDGDGADGGDEHPATISARTTARAPRNNPGIVRHLHLRRKVRVA
ncbi:hypothetical protein GCM10009641_07150 [Mycobacterium cookii]|uniref:Uncharacterized protein n=1 Tax=Mycobacterium cookii TaxID=1775 RepID=A0A7I7L1K3_9MYCO|nr:hypothetical protein MCOO_42550 [Mycobacterium cookii]